MCTMSVHWEARSSSCASNSTIISPQNQILMSMLQILSEHNDQTGESNKKDDPDQDLEVDLKRWPSLAEIVEELKQMSNLAGPLVILGLLLYARTLTSMLFLGHLGQLELAGGSLSIGFANITGYSVLSGLALGMEPICGQAYGAKNLHLIGLTLQRMILILLCACLPISLLWLSMQSVLIWCGQEKDITEMANTYILFSLPDLIIQAVLNPLRIYLRTQGITTPLTWCAALAVTFHLPINFFLVFYMDMRVEGVALGAAWSNLNLVLFLIFYLRLSGRFDNSWEGWSLDCLKEWKSLLSLAIPSCVSVCLEWWWYECMIILSGLLSNARAAIATMGILIQTTSLVYIFPSSLSLAVSIRVGNELGASRPAKARFAMLVALGLAAALGAIAMALTTSMRHIWASLFSDDEQILSLTTLAMPIVGLCELGNCPQTTGCGVLRGSARPAVGANINLGSFYLVGMPVAVVLGFVLKTGFAGLWLGLLAAQATCATLMLIVMSHTNWSRQAKRAEQLIKPERPSDLSSITCKPSNCVNSELEMKAVSDIRFNMEDMNEEGPLLISVEHNK